MIKNYNVFPKHDVFGDIIRLKTTSPLHSSGKVQKLVSEDANENFAHVLSKAVGQVNAQQLYSENLSQKAIADPESVQVHNLKIAMEKAKMSLTFTKRVTDLAIRTYRDLVNLR